MVLHFYCESGSQGLECRPPVWRQGGGMGLLLAAGREGEGEGEGRRAVHSTAWPELGARSSVFGAGVASAACGRTRSRTGTNRTDRQADRPAEDDDLNGEQS